MGIARLFRNLLRTCACVQAELKQRPVTVLLRVAYEYMAFAVGYLEAVRAAVSLLR
jgi:hypothetical protein